MWISATGIRSRSTSGGGGFSGVPFTIMLFLVIFIGLDSVVMNEYKVNNRIKKSAKYPLYIAGFFPMSNDTVKGRVGHGVLPAVQLAINDINNDKSIIPDYVLHIDAQDTKCDAGTGLKVFFDFMYNLPRKIILFGDVCSVVTDAVAKASRHWSITQLSYGDTHPMYSSKMYPNLFRIVPSEIELNEPIIELLQLYHWRRVGTLYQNSPRYSVAINNLIADLEHNGIEVVQSQSFVDQIVRQMQILKESDVRIVIGRFNETWARRIFCEAYKAGMYGKHYQWLLMAADYDVSWWRLSEDTDCTLANIETALEGTILVDFLPLSTSDDITISGRTSRQYKEIYDSMSRGRIQSSLHGYAYDGIWAIGLALHNLLKSKNSTSYLTTFEYKNKQWESEITDSLRDIVFIGVTGPIRFRDNGRKGLMLIKQFQNFHTVNIGEFDAVSQVLNLTKYYPEQLNWNNRLNEPPKDRTVTLIEPARINLKIFIVLTFLSSVGILASIFCLVVNIKFRGHRYIKMSSPNLNNLITIGCIFSYMSIIVFGLDSALTTVDLYPYICTARVWILMAGFTLVFGSMFSKTWRSMIKDMQLFLIVGILVTIDLIIMISWQLLDPFYRETRNLQRYTHPQDDNIEIIPSIELCKSNYINTFTGIIYTYKGLLLVFGCFLAWETRHASLPALNDSKYIGMNVYNCVVMSLIGAPLSHILIDKQTVSFTIISILIIFCTSGTLCAVFLPKIIELKRNPEGTTDNNIRVVRKLSLSTSAGDHNRQTATSLSDKEFKTAKKNNTKYRKRIQEIDSEIQSQLKILGKEGEEILRAMDSPTLP